MSNKDKYIINNVNVENIRNRQETRVVELVREALPERKDFCGCSLCIQDVYALMLNSMPPQYAQVGSLVFRKPPPEKKELVDLVTQAIDKVKAIPNHPAKTETGT